MTDSAASAHRDPRALTAAQTESYDRLGYLSPLVAMPPSGAQAPRWKLEVVEASRGRPSSTRSRTSSARISSCWSREFFIKDGYDSSYVSWHQDSTSWRLSYPDVVTALAQLAFTLGNVAHGSMRVIPRSHPATRSRIGTRSRPPIS